MDRYEELRRYLETFVPPADLRFPRHRGLARMKLLLSHLDNPHEKYKTVHVVGTSGKGSTATILAKILSTAGYKTGLTISPHLQVINERIQIDGQMISVDSLFRRIEEIKPAVEKTASGAFGTPTYYEILLALAFLQFAKEKVGIAVVEAGLGGTWDGTNVIRPLLGVLTNVGLDHTEVLGPTLLDIARDKAGMIKPGMVVVSGIRQPSIIKMINEECTMKNAKLLLLERDFTYAIEELTDRGTSFDYNNVHYRSEIKNLWLSLVGKHQVENAALAITTALFLKPHGFSVGEKAIRQALKTVFIPGRMEVVQVYPRVVLDGAHNPDKIAAMLETLPLFKTWRRRWIGVVAFKRDKPVLEMIHMLIPNMRQLIVTEFHATTDVGKNTSFSAQEVYDVAKTIRSKRIKARAKTYPFPDIKEAVQIAIETAGSTGSVIVTGSLYLVGEVRDLFYPKEELLTTNA